MSIGSAVRHERRRRGITARQLADKARLSAASINALEAGQRLSLEAYARVAVALGLPLDLTVDRRRPRERADLVHAAMGEYEARRLRASGVSVAIDHPYQHYQFAGRADVLAPTQTPPAVLHGLGRRFGAQRSFILVSGVVRQRLDRPAGGTAGSGMQTIERPEDMGVRTSRQLG